MPSSILSSFDSLRLRNADPTWLWSMLLTRGLSWENVWDVFSGGVYSQNAYSSKTKPANRVMNAWLLSTLPDSPTTITELFQKVNDLRARYPEDALLEGGGILNRTGIIDEVLSTFKNVCIPDLEEIKAILDKAHVEMGLNKDNHFLQPDLFAFLQSFCPPGQEQKVLEYMVEQENLLLDAYGFLKLLAAVDPDIPQLWHSIRTKNWNNPERILCFIQNTKWDDNNCKPIEVFEFLQKYPELVDSLHTEIFKTGKKNPGNPTIFELGAALMGKEPNRLIEWYYNSHFDIALANIEKLGLAEQPLHFKSILRLYQCIPAEERDSPPAKTLFAHLFLKTAIHLENYQNDHCESILTDIMKTSPGGSIGRVLALHACVFASSPEQITDGERKMYNALFRHDPTTKSGRNSIIRKYIPEVKPLLTLTQSLGLNQETLWHQLMTQSVNTALPISYTIDNLCEEIMHG